jgi:hypothetical protein
MTRKQNLQALYDAVKAGADEIDMLPAFPDVQHRNWIALILTPGDIRAMGAAIALQKAVLPEWLMVEMSEGDKSTYIDNWVVVLGRREEDGIGLAEASARDPARALLLAILAVLIAQEGDQ